MGIYNSTKDGADVDAAVDFVESQQAIKKYVALLSQSGIDAPVATVLENTIGNIVWSRVSTGLYQAILSNAFTVDKIYLIPNQYTAGLYDELSGYFYRIIFSRSNESTLNLQQKTADGITSTLIDGITNLRIEIRVYP